MLAEKHDRPRNCSVRQFDDLGTWTGRSNETGWSALLGARRGTDEVTPYDAAARATWLGGLPPVLITVGSAEPFRDEDVAFASAIWREGGDCDLHAQAGGVHGYRLLRAWIKYWPVHRQVVDCWVDRMVHPDDPADGLRSWASWADPRAVEPH